MWVQKYLDNTEREWKCTLEYFSKKRNLRLFLRSNFDADELSNYMPSYYMNAIKNWSRLSEIMAKSSLQPLWYNKEIKIGFKSACSENLFSIGLWYVNDLFEEQNLIPFNTWVHRGANELDRMTWSGIVQCISKKWNIQPMCQDQSSLAKGFTRALNKESVFVGIENISQKHIKVCLAEKISSLKEADFKYRMKNELIHGIVRDDEWENIFMIPTLCPVDNKTKDLQYKIRM